MTTLNNKEFIHNNSIYIFQPKDPISAGTHFFGFICAIIALPILLMHSSQVNPTLRTQIGLTIFMLSMILLYGASSSYHAFNINPKMNLILKKIDHMSIFILIAGTYTPICLSILEEKIGFLLLFIIWSIALSGIIFKFFWVTCPKWVSSIMYIGMGWACISVLPQLYTNLGFHSFLWLLLGGLFYTTGGIIYALKLNLIKKNTIGFGNHELFHLFVMAGSFCHFMAIYLSI